MVRTLPHGCYAPIPTFFDSNEDVDVEATSNHTVYLAKLGMMPVIAGSMGEAHHLTPEERTAIISGARKALDAAGLKDTPIIAGTGLGSTRGTIELSKQAAQAGADCAIVIASGYYAGALDKKALIKFFVDVAEASPIPVMIYNFPGASGGIDLDSFTINEIAASSKNICGVKLTCGGVGKLTRISGHSKSFKDQEFLTLGGFADFILPTVLASGSAGAIMGLGNLYPHTITHLFKLSKALASDYSPSALAEATKYQTLVSDADAIYAPLGIAGTKATLQKRLGYGGLTRLPLLPFSEERLAATEAREEIKAINKVEAELAAKAGGKSNGK